MKTFKTPFKTLWILPGLALAVAGCNQGENGTTATGATGPINDSAAGINKITDAPASVSEPNEPVRGYLRAVHTVRGAGPVALAVDGVKVTGDLPFGSASDFVGLHGEKVKIHSTEPHQITVVNAADGKPLGSPLALDLERGEDITVVIGGAPGKITLTPFEHTNRGPSRTNAKIAVMHADKALPEVGISVDGKMWAGDIGYGEVTGYKQLTPGAHTLKVMYDKSMVGILDIDRKPGVSPPPPIAIRANNLITLTQPINVEDGKVYSVIVYQDAGGRPRLRFAEDKFVPALIRAEDAGGNAPTNVGADAVTDANAVTDAVTGANAATNAATTP